MAFSNRLLQSLSPGSRTSFLGRLQGVALPVGTVLYEAGETPQYAYFITSGIASVVAEMEDGGGVEVGLFGCESLPGSIRLLGAQSGTTRCFMQVAGSGMRIGMQQLQDEFHRNPELHARILQHVQYEALTLAQLSACNRLHELEERLARWLLMVSDRIESDEITLTQDFLAKMLGTRRSSVTVGAGTLQRAGLIDYRRGSVRILDHANLEEAACECYPTMRRLHRELYQDPIIG